MSNTCVLADGTSRTILIYAVRMRERFYRECVHRFRCGHRLTEKRFHWLQGIFETLPNLLEITAGVIHFLLLECFAHFMICRHAAFVSLRQGCIASERRTYFSFYWIIRFSCSDPVSCMDRGMNILVLSDTWLVTHDTRLVTHDTWLVAHDTWLVTHDTWLVTHDTWLVTHDTWHVKNDILRCLV
jgi:hypothetical protein